MKVLELKGLRSLEAFKAYNALLFGFKMMPALLSEAYVSFFEETKELPESKKEEILRVALSFVELSDSEKEALLSFATDGNGIPYSKASIKNLGLKDFFEAIIAVCMEIAKIDISLVSEEEKKKFQTSQSTSGDNTSSILN